MVAPTTPRGQDLFHTLDMPVWEAEALDLTGWCAARIGDLGTAVRTARPPSP